MKSLILVILLGISGVFASVYPTVDFEEKEGMILDAVLRFMDAYHFSPQDINDDYSEKAFDLYIKYLDGGKRFLTQKDIDQLEEYKYQIDDQIKDRSLAFFEKSMELIEPATENAKMVYDQLITEDFDINRDDYIEMDGEKRTFATNKEALKDFWRDMLTYDLINRVSDKMDAQKDSINKKTVEEIKVAAKEDMVESYDNWFKRMDKVRRSDRFETYINSLTHLFDPHTDYFNPKEKKDFDIRMGGKLEGIGARLQADNDYIKVSEIIPGGPAWKGKELEKNDLITAVRQDGEDEALDIFGMRLDDVVQKIRGDKGTIVFLTVKKEDGSTAIIEIERDEVIIDEGFAKSLILDMPNSLENIGYIKLPKFYDSFEGKKGNSCAKDVAAEIEKLKENNVNGIILDLRNNSGGSLRDVVTMSGLFIEEGPIVQVKPRDRAASVYDDEDKDVQYDGPLVVMVNQFSASASEILAAALQDYGRAVIVGSNSTFGKGTVQRFVNLDDAFRGVDEMKPLGNLKITMQKFYRINGGSTQLNGVNPDIILPDNYHLIDTGEKEYDYALDWTEIEPVDYDQKVYNISNLDELSSNSAERVASNENFNLVLKNAARLKEIRDESSYPLNLDNYSAIMNKRLEQAEQFDSLYERKLETIAVKNLDQDLPSLEIDESKKARNDEWIKNINNDFYIEEVLYILKDMIAQNN